MYVYMSICVCVYIIHKYDAQLMQYLYFTNISDIIDIN